MPVKRKGGGGRELQRIRWLRSLADESVSPVFPLSIGDDAAIWTPSRGSNVVLTVDVQVEGVHFRRDWMSLGVIGARAVTSSVSDLAAMAARPAAILVSLVLEAGMSDAEFRRLYIGIHRAARDYGTRILGGNLSSGPLSITVTALGEGRPGQLLRRSGARSGDEIWVTGQPGLARLGWKAFEQGTLHSGADLAGAGRKLMARAKRSFTAPRARLTESVLISKNLRPSAMIDLSDGLASDLRHILEASSAASDQELGAELWEEPLVPDKAFEQVARALGEAGADSAIQGGEDYELCFTARPDPEIRRAAARLSGRLGLRIARIGRIVSRRGLTRVDRRGVASPVEVHGWEHFGIRSVPRSRSR